jgi:uncharacterized protein YcbK (DUF882 family)
MENVLNADVLPQLSSSPQESQTVSIDGQTSSSMKINEKNSKLEKLIKTIKEFYCNTPLIYTAIVILLTLLGSYPVIISPMMSEVEKQKQIALVQNNFATHKQGVIDSLTYELNTLKEQIQIEKSNQFLEEDFASKDAPWTGKRFDTSLVRVLYKLELITGEKIHINSAYRTRSRNADVGGAERSMHMAGRAVDIRCLDEQYRYELIQAAMSLGVQRIGIHPRFIHIDLGADNRLWLY